MAWEGGEAIGGIVLRLYKYEVSLEVNRRRVLIRLWSVMWGAGVDEKSRVRGGGIWKINGKRSWGSRGMFNCEDGERVGWRVMVTDLHGV